DVRGVQGVFQARERCRRQQRPSGRDHVGGRPERAAASRRGGEEALGDELGHRRGGHVGVLQPGPDRIGTAGGAARAARHGEAERPREMGLEAVPVVVVPSTAADFGPFAQKLKEAGADWVFSWALWHVELGVFEALQRLGWTGNYVLYGHQQTEDDLARLK